jgi:hypothetical protein
LKKTGPEEVTGFTSRSGNVDRPEHLAIAEAKKSKTTRVIAEGLKSPPDYASTGEKQNEIL